MLADFHFLRPIWLLMLLPLLVLGWTLVRHRQGAAGQMEKICDPHLLPFLIHTKSFKTTSLNWLWLYIASVFMVMGLAGPAWKKLSVPTYQSIQPHVILLNMSEAMNDTDLPPNRLSRAKFKLHDLFSMPKIHGQFGLIAYTSEPFIVSPLTDDTHTLDALLPMLASEIMPVKGNKLVPALEEAKALIIQAGFNYGQFLVMTSIAPSEQAIQKVKALHQMGFTTSLLPILPPDSSLTPAFKAFANAGGGELLPFDNQAQVMQQWLHLNPYSAYFKKHHQTLFPEWQDEGWMCVILALFALAPLFRKGAVEGLAV